MRVTAAGDAVCSLPCLLCRRQLEAFHVRWSARDWHGWVDQTTAPPSQLTQRQRNEAQRRP
jgi:hypothetical protein